MIKSLVKVQYWIKRSQNSCKNLCKALVILTKGGVPLIRLGDQSAVEECLEGGFLTAASILSKICFESELNQIITSKNQILIRGTENFIGYLILKGTNKNGKIIANARLSRLLNRLESTFYDEDITLIQPREVEPIVTQYANLVAETW